MLMGPRIQEAYLFRAACSELGTEIKTNRRLQMEQMRQQRTHLQHDLDILTQTLNQELLTLSDSVRGLFHNRNMTVREEHKAVDSAVCLFLCSVMFLRSPPLSAWVLFLGRLIFCPGRSDL